MKKIIATFLAACMLFAFPMMSYAIVGGESATAPTDPPTPQDFHEYAGEVDQALQENIGEVITEDMQKGDVMTDTEPLYSDSGEYLGSVTYTTVKEEDAEAPAPQIRPFASKETTFSKADGTYKTKITVTMKKVWPNFNATIKYKLSGGGKKLTNIKGTNLPIISYAMKPTCFYGPDVGYFLSNPTKITHSSGEYISINRKIRIQTSNELTPHIIIVPIKAGIKIVSKGKLKMWITTDQKI